MAWLRILFEGAKTHLVHDSMRADLIAEMALRGIEVAPRRHPSADAAPISEVDSYAIDAGGLAIQGSPWIDVQVGDLPFSIPAEQVALYRRAIDNLPIRTFASGQRYQKLHGAWHCIVLAPELMLELGAALAAKLAEADAADREFWLEHEKLIASRAKP